MCCFPLTCSYRAVERRRTLITSRPATCWYQLKQYRNVKQYETVESLLSLSVFLTASERSSRSLTKANIGKSAWSQRLTFPRIIVWTSTQYFYANCLMNRNKSWLIHMVIEKSQEKLATCWWIRRTLLACCNLWLHFSKRRPLNVMGFCGETMSRNMKQCNMDVH